MHLSPEHESHLASSLGSRTDMPVTQVNETMPLEPDHVYVIPPNRNLDTVDTHLRLSPLEEERRERPPIDHFFRTLAETHGEKVVAIILSGTGSDGSVGLRHIKERGGLTIVQDPREAEYETMPRSALATGQVDLSLSVNVMPTRLLEYLNSAPLVFLPKDDEPLPKLERESVQKVLSHLRVRTGHDFSQYKAW